MWGNLEKGDPGKPSEGGGGDQQGQMLELGKEDKF